MAVPERMSDRHAKSGEDMMEVLAHDIMRYETLSEQSDLFALALALAGKAPNDQYTIIELNVPAVPQLALNIYCKKHVMRYKTNFPLKTLPNIQ